MNQITQSFIEDSGIKRIDKDWLGISKHIRIFLREGEDCTPPELLIKIIVAAKKARSLEIFNLISGESHEQNP